MNAAAYVSRGRPSAAAGPVNHHDEYDDDDFDDIEAVQNSSDSFDVVDDNFAADSSNSDVA